MASIKINLLKTNFASTKFIFYQIFEMGLIRKIGRKLRAGRKKYIENQIDYLFSWSGFTSSLYYFLVSPEFYREHRAVLKGRIKHVNDFKRRKSNYYLLVRNVHRIEKGLTMKPQRKIFAKDFISETVSSFHIVLNDIVKKSSTELNQLKWAYDVLLKYFKTVGGDPILDREKTKFNLICREFAEIINTISRLGNGVDYIPYRREDIEFSNVDYKSFHQLCKQRRSVRWFKSKKVDRSVIDQIISSACYAPSACNRQPFEFFIFDDPEKVKKVAKFPMGTKGYVHNIPVFIVIVGNLDAYFDERDRHLIYIDGSLASMSFMLAAETLGLSTCPINWPDIEEREKKMADFLKLKSYQRPIMCMALGYADPDGLIAYSEKRAINLIRHYK